MWLESSHNRCQRDSSRVRATKSRDSCGVIDSSHVIIASSEKTRLYSFRSPLQYCSPMITSDLSDETRWFDALFLCLELPLLMFNITSEVFREICYAWSFGDKSDVEWAVANVFHVSSPLRIQKSLQSLTLMCVCLPFQTTDALVAALRITLNFHYNRHFCWMTISIK